MPYEDKDIEFLYELLQKTIKYQKTPGMSILEEIASGIDLLSHKWKHEIGAKMDERRFSERIQKDRDKLSEQVHQLKEEVTSLKSQLKSK